MISDMVNQKVNGSSDVIECENCRLYGMARALEFEGSISITKSKSEKSKGGYRYYMQISIANTENDLLQWLVEDFGGGVSVHSPYSDNHSDSGTWHMNGDKSSKLLLLLLPFFKSSRKLELAKLAIEFQKGQNRGVKRSDDRIVEQEEFWIKAKELNARGNRGSDIVHTVRKKHTDTTFLGIEFDESWGQ